LTVTTKEEEFEEGGDNEAIEEGDIDQKWKDPSFRIRVSEALIKFTQWCLESGEDYTPTLNSLAKLIGVILFITRKKTLVPMK